MSLATSPIALSRTPAELETRQLRDGPKTKIRHTTYQVDFAAVNCGLFIGASKRIVRFKFGYTNLGALDAGKRGAECRGSEHEVIITWSLSSGKQAVAYDEHEVFFTVCDSTRTKFSHSWRDENGHTFFIIAHAATLSLRTDTFLIPNPDWRQYDLFIDGVSFFHMPLLCDVGGGLNVASVRDGHGSRAASITPHTTTMCPRAATAAAPHSPDASAVLRRRPIPENGDDSEREMSDRNSTRSDEETVLLSLAGPSKEAWQVIEL
jgi:hypothetical protein